MSDHTERRLHREPDVERSSVTTVEQHGIESIPDVDRDASIFDFMRLCWGGANSLATAGTWCISHHVWVVILAGHCCDGSGSYRRLACSGAHVDLWSSQRDQQRSLFKRPLRCCWSDRRLVPGSLDGNRVLRDQRLVEW